MTAPQPPEGGDAAAARGVAGPVQVLVVGFDEAAVSGDVVAELNRLTEAGVVRLIDVLLVTRAADGSLDTIAPPPGSDPGRGRVAAALLGVPADAPDGTPVDSDARPGDTSAQEGSWSLDESVPAGGVAAVALVEHLWAQPLVAALRGAGARPLDETWLAPEDVALLDQLVKARAAGLDQ
ncbi:DUF1269 domain-containing protein [Intrasporangium mesophilum]